MNAFTLGFALLAGLLHVLFFCMESLWFMKPAVYRSFGATSAEDAEAKRLFAYNQGFYNLFLAIGIFVGVGLACTEQHIETAQALILFSTACMFGASLVLLQSGGTKMLRAVAIQGLCPLLAWLFWLAM